MTVDTCAGGCGVTVERQTVVSDAPPGFQVRREDRSPVWCCSSACVTAWARAHLVQGDTVTVEFARTEASPW